MIRKYRGIALTLVLLVLIAIVVHRTFRQKAKLKIAYWHLSGNFVINEYLGDVNQPITNEFAYRRKHEPSFMEVGDAALRLNEVVDSMYASYVSMHENRQPSDLVEFDAAAKYFSGKISVAPDHREKLWNAFDRYREEIEDYLQREVNPAREYYARTLVADSRQFPEIEEKIKKGKDGKFAENFSMHLFRDTVIIGQVYARKTANGIEWNKTAYDDYIGYLKQKVSSSNPLQLAKEIASLENSFLSKDKIVIYGKTYELSRLTIHEFATVCTHIRLQKAGIDRLIIETAREINPL